MSSRTGSTVLTFLMSIPVAAVGLMAVFGVPPLSAVIAASRAAHDVDLGFGSDTTSHRGSRNERNSSTEEAPDWSMDEESVDMQADSDSENSPKDDLGFSVSTLRNRKKPSGRSFGGREESAESSADDALRFSDEKQRTPAHGRGLARTASNAFEDDASATSGSRRVSMKESLKKLNSLNVKKYHLVPGSEPNTWLFVCMFAPGDDQRVFHRFESEDADPDMAVAKTIEQIDAWLLKRFKDNTSLSQMAN